MKMLAILLLTLCSPLFISNVHLAPSGPAQKVDCDQLLLTGDTAMGKIMFLGDANRTSFSSKDDLDENYCKPFLGNLKQITNYSKCLRSFSKSMLNLMATNVKKIYKSVCLNSEKLEEAYSHVKCMNEKTKSDLAQTTNIGVALITYVGKLENIDDIIPALCCGSLEYWDSFESTVDTICSKTTGSATGKYMMQVVRNVFGDAVELMCGKYPTKDSCKTQKPELFDAVKNSMLNPPQQSSSFAVPLVTLVKRLDGLTI